MLAEPSERWLPVVGHDGYEVSDQGRVRSLDRVVPHPEEGRTYAMRLSGKVLRPSTDRDGYLHVCLHSSDRKVKLLIHRVVLTAFYRPPEPGEECNHKDFNKGNNCSKNLEWLTHQKNVVHTHAHGRVASARGERHGRAKLDTDDVVAILARHANGERQQALAIEYGIHQTTISRIVLRQTWKHI